jgi:hypothetical protein
MGKMLEVDPEFASSADKYSISHAPRPMTFTIEDGRTNDVYEMKVTWSKEIAIDSSIDESALEKGDAARQRSFVAHKGLLQNPIDGKSYDIVGTTTIFRSLERHSNDMTEETVTMSFPIEFSIFEQGQDVGTITLKSASLPLLIDLSLHGRLVSIEHSVRPKQRQVALGLENERIAFFDVKSEGYNVTEYKGGAYLKPGVTRDVMADCFTSYVIANTMMGILADK